MSDIKATAPVAEPKAPNPASAMPQADVESQKGVVLEQTAHVVDHAAERALCRKFDLRLLPVLAIMYLFNSLDKSNLGNAKTAGLPDDLGFASGQYNLILSIFFIPYVLFAPPVAMLGKKFGPARVLPSKTTTVACVTPCVSRSRLFANSARRIHQVLMVCFGSCTLLIAACKNFGGVFALRFLLGISESAFFPLVIYYQTTFYRRGELARRLAIFYAASSIASAFSGLLSYGVFQIQSHLVDFKWRWLFIIEGALTVAFAVFAYWYLPKSAAEARFLNDAEKALAFHRIQVDSSSVVNEEFNLRESLKIFLRPTTYGFLIIEICLGVPLQGVQLFLPQIVERLGYDSIKTNLYTVAPNVTGAVMLLVLAFSSDFLRIRFPLICLGFAFTFIGFIIFQSVTDVHAQAQIAYFATFMMCWGTAAPSVLLSTWYNNNVAHEGERITLTSVGVPLANLMGLVASNVFRDQDKPKYAPALITIASFGACGCLMTAVLGAYMMWDNKKRNSSQGVILTARDVPTMKLRDGPKVPEFRWFL